MPRVRPPTRRTWPLQRSTRFAARRNAADFPACSTGTACWRLLVVLTARKAARLVRNDGGRSVAVVALRRMTPPNWNNSSAASRTPRSLPRWRTSAGGCLTGSVIRS